MLTQKSHVLLIQHLIYMDFKTIKVMKNIYNKTIRILFLFALVLTFASCDYQHEHEIPSIIIKNNTNQTINLQHFGELTYDGWFSNGHYYGVLSRKNGTLDTHHITLKPQESHFVTKGGIEEALGARICNHFFGSEEHSFLISADIEGACFMIVDNNDQEKILKKWTPDYDSNSLFKEFYRLSDWKFLANEGVRDNDAYVFEIEDSDLISE